MADEGHILTEKKLSQLEENIRREYEKATNDMRAKLEAYLEKTEAQRKVQESLLKDGKITKKEYQDWCYRHAMIGKRWEEMQQVLADDLKHADKIAKSMMKKSMPDIYALNCNYATYRIEHDAEIDTGFTLYNHDTAEYLLGDQRQLMPQPSTRKAAQIKANADMQWNKNHIQSAVLQGVLQGESPYDVAKRLQQVGQMNYNSAVRYARTMTTSAQNAGRYESFHRAKDLGVDLTIEWQATLDHRTRHAHRMMHGQRTEVDKPFYTPDGYTIYYPADCTGESTAPQSEIWNCRCTLLSWVKGFEGDTIKDAPGMDGMSFEEWQREKADSDQRQTVSKQFEEELRHRKQNGEFGSYKEARLQYIKDFTGYDEEKSKEIQNELREYFSGARSRVNPKIIDQYIDRAPVYDGEMFRGLHFTESEFNEFIKNGVITSRNVNVSWTDELDTAKVFARGDNLMVILECISNRTGTPVAHLSAEPEGEILTRSTAKWEIVKKEKRMIDGKEYWWIQVVEKYGS